jgi:hypothetical protein
MGGGLMQIILPSIIGFYFLKTYYRTGVQFSLLWLGQNFINISVYAADARAQALPLLGGNSVYHDWHYLLGEINLLEYDHEIGIIIYGIGLIMFLIAVLLPLIMKD